MRVSDIALLVSILVFCISCMILYHVRPSFVMAIKSDTGALVFSEEKMIMRSMVIGLFAGFITVLVCCKSRYAKDVKIATKMGFI